jgi:hypothetical protein
MVCIGRADGSMEYLDQHLLDYAGLPAEDVRGWGWLRLIHPEDASIAERTWKELFKGGEPYAAQKQGSEHCYQSDQRSENKLQIELSHYGRRDGSLQALANVLGASQQCRFRNWFSALSTVTSFWKSSKISHGSSLLPA